MELQYFGANCVRITTKGTSIVVDDNLEELGLKSITKPTDISLRTSNLITAVNSQFSADMPGEYEIADAVIHGVAARGHMDEEGKKSATIFTITANDLKVAIIGHVYPEFNDDQLEQMGLVDVVVIPVGGNGYTLDGVGALQIIKKVEPKVVIPTHFADKSIKYKVPQVELAEALKNLGMEPTEVVDKYKPKSGEISDTAHLIVLNRQ